MEGYLAAAVFAEGVKRAGRQVTRESLINGLETMQKMDFHGFNINFSGTSHVASKFVDVSMLTGDGNVRR